jgi:hypothetical protein
MTQLEILPSKRMPPTRSQAVEGVITSPMNMNLAELQAKMLVHPKDIRVENEWKPTIKEVRENAARIRDC